MSTTQAPRLSVIVASYGGAQRLPHLLDALLHQNQAPSYEVCVVIDGDIDGSAAVIERWKECHPDFALAYQVFDTNQGRVAALNAAAAMACGEILIRADDDLQPTPDYLHLHSRAHEGSGPMGVIGLYRNQYPDTPYARAYAYRADHNFRDQAYRSDSTQRWRYWAGNVSIPRTVFWDVGGYDPDYRRYGWEDVDFGYRLHTRSIPVILAPELETTHNAAATTTRSRVLRALHAGAARAIFTAKHGDNALPVVLPTGVWGVLVRGIAAVAGSKTFHAVTAVVDRILPVVPSAIGEKTVALLVESAGLAGSSHPERARETF